MPELTVRVPKNDLVARIQENRDKHRGIFEAALDGYKVQITEHLEKALADVRAGKIPNLSFRYPIPEDHTEDYDRVLDMLSLHAGDEIEISQDDFATFVRDDWHWKRQFLAAASNYTVIQ